MNLPQLTDPWHYYTYRYDQLNRLTRTDVYKATGTAYNVTYVNDYKELFGYDPNGNITTVNRYANAGTQMDNMVYHYNTDASGKLTNNRLNYNNAHNIYINRLTRTDVYKATGQKNPCLKITC